MEIRKSTAADFDAFYRMKCDPVINAWSGHTNIPDYERLKTWYLRTLNETDKRIIYLFFTDAGAVGYFYVDFLTPEKVDVSYAIASDQSGKGLGTRMMSLMLGEIGSAFPAIKQADAWVLTDNIGSEKICLKNGFVHSGITKDIVHLGVNKKMVRFEYSF